MGTRFATTNVERFAQGLGTLPEVETSCLLAFPMVYLLIAVSLDRLGPDLALGRLPPEWVKKSARRGGWRRESRNKANSKIRFRHPG